MALDLSKYQDLATKQGPNMAEATAGGGDYTPPAAGLARLRLIAYVEVGKHTSTYEGTEKTADKVQLVFELSGPKHQPQTLEDGTVIPHRITIYENAGRDYGALNEKANLYKLFRKMNYDGAATHFAQLVGKEFLGTVVHKPRKGGKPGEVSASLRDTDGYTVRAPMIEVLDEDTGEVTHKRIAVAPAISPLRLFLWNFADLDMWQSLFISQERNPFQTMIKQANNFSTSPIYMVLAEAGLDVTVPAKGASRADVPSEGAAPASGIPQTTAPVGKAADDVLGDV